MAASEGIVTAAAAAAFLAACRLQVTVRDAVCCQWPAEWLERQRPGIAGSHTPGTTARVELRELRACTPLTVAAADVEHRTVFMAVDLGCGLV